jgi:pantoate--beta-alanine ligase
LVPPYTTVDSLREQLHEDKSSGKSIGFVPTMGALHEGHLSLLHRAKAENDKVVCSIFVNPTQFNDAKDLEKYPRMPEQDIQLLDSVHCDYVFLPSVKEIYPAGPTLLDLEFGTLESVMEGAYRPGHFKGMATVVHRLFEIVQPDRAYFGEKDFQQLAIVRKMTAMLRLPVNVIGCETLREADGLAMSSRNMLLSPEQRKAAPLIYKGLQMVSAFIPHHSPSAVKELVTRFINQSKFLEVQYFDLVDPDDLQPIAHWEGVKEIQGCIAVLTEGPRLIDNMHYQL